MHHLRNLFDTSQGSLQSLVHNYLANQLTCKWHTKNRTNFGQLQLKVRSKLPAMNDELNYQHVLNKPVLDSTDILSWLKQEYSHHPYSNRWARHNLSHHKQKTESLFISSVSGAQKQEELFRNHCTQKPTSIMLQRQVAPTCLCTSVW